MSDSYSERRESDREPCPNGYRRVFTPYITVNGKRKWHPEWFTKGKVYSFCVPEEDYRQDN
jgi:hypothetical protein